jgi:hypothetical protein
LGVTVGFLFGIPRTLQGDHDAASAQTTPQSQELRFGGYSQRVNTNLEQISDWLTKILVGLTLTQLGNIGTKLGEAAAWIAPGLGSTPHAEVFASALIVYFTVIGFMSGYLLTRLVLAGAFYRAHVSTRLQDVETTVNEVFRVSSENRVSADVTGALQFLDNTAAAPADVIQIFLKKLEQGRKEFPLNRRVNRVNIVLARLYDEKLGRRDTAVRILTEFVKSKEAAGTAQDEDTAAALYNLACYYSLDSNIETDPGRKSALQLKAATTLRESCEKDRQNVLQAIDDHDPGSNTAARGVPENNEGFWNLVLLRVFSVMVFLVYRLDLVPSCCTSDIKLN